MKERNCLGRVDPMRKAQYYGSFEYSEARAGISCQTPACPLRGRLFGQMIGLSELDAAKVAKENAGHALALCTNKPSNRQRR